MDIKRLPISAIVLLISNVIGIIIAVTQHLDFGAVVWAYWFESLIVGFFTVLAFGAISIHSLAAKEYAGFILGLFFGGFFIVHYGIFHLVYLVFLSVMPWFYIDPSWYLWIATTVGVLFLSHGFSFVVNIIKNPAELDGSQDNLKRLMGAPYSRIIPMHLTIILSGFIVGPLSGTVGTDARTALLVLFMSLKTIADCWGHVGRYRKA